MMRFAPLLRLDLRHDYHGDGAGADRARARRGDPAARPPGPTCGSASPTASAEVFAAEDRTALARLADEDALVLTFRLRPRGTRRSPR